MLKQERKRQEKQKKELELQIASIQSVGVEAMAVNRKIQEQFNLEKKVKELKDKKDREQENYQRYEKLITEMNKKYQEYFQKLKDDGKLPAEAEPVPLEQKYHSVNLEEEIK